MLAGVESGRNFRKKGVTRQMLLTAQRLSLTTSGSDAKLVSSNNNSLPVSLLCRDDTVRLLGCGILYLIVFLNILPFICDAKKERPRDWETSFCGYSVQL